LIFAQQKKHEGKNENSDSSGAKSKKKISKKCKKIYFNLDQVSK
jgi:hypothetical protein